MWSGRRSASCMRQPAVWGPLQASEKTYGCRYRGRRQATKNTMMMTAARLAWTPSALMVAPQRSMSNLSDMRSSPLKGAESLRGTMYLRVDLPGIMAQTPQAQRTGRPHMGTRHDPASCGGLFGCLGWHGIRRLIAPDIGPALPNPLHGGGNGPGAHLEVHPV